MTSINENSVTEDAKETPKVMLKSRSDSGEYNGGDNSFEVESQSSQMDGISSHKRRTKASRACDQCRKRKIRCDYSDDKGICTSCTKNGERCTFDRVPLKRGPSKGTTRGNSASRSISSENNNIVTGNTSGAGCEFSSPSSRQGSILLPPLAQYLPQPAQPNLNTAQQQQFWKVPYHEFQGQRRGSIDSLSSDISVKSVNTPQEHMFYTSPSTGHPPLQSPVTFGSVNPNTDGGYWPFRNSGGEEVDGLRRRSGSYPSSKSVSQPPIQQQQQHSYSKSNSSFGHYGTNGFPSRQGSIASEGMSPSATMPYQSMPMNHSSSNNLSQLNKSQKQQQEQHIQWPKVQSRSQSQSQPLPPPQVHVHAVDKEEKPSQNTKRRRTVSTSINEGNKEPNEYPLARFSNSSKESLMGGSSVSPAGFVYGQIPEVQLIDTYYEFIHMIFPIIPLNKETVTNEILLVNTQPISPIHEINNYVILWFRNSLELLVRISLKRKNGHFYDSLMHNKEKEAVNELGGNSNKDGSDSTDDDSGMQAIFVTALNECLQKIVDIHPSFRENKDEISPKIKIIYLCTFVLLNYILAIVGYDNSFVLGMSVTIFKDFRVYELLLYDDEEENDLDDCSIKRNNTNINTNTYNDTNTTTNVNTNNSSSHDNTNTNWNVNNGINVNKNDNKNKNGSDNNSNDDDQLHYKNNEVDNTTRLDQGGYSIIFKRLYVLLIIFDSLQCCSYGGPKLLNVPIEGASMRFFRPKPDGDSKWIVDQSPTRVKCILQSVKLGELLSELSMNRRSICDVSCRQLHWEIKPYFEERVTDEDDEPSSLSYSFAAFVLCRKKFVDYLLKLQNLETGKLFSVDMEICGEMAGLLCQLTSLILQVLTVMMRTNPKNCIDHNYRPMRPMEQGNGQSSTGQESSGQNLTTTATTTTPGSMTVFPVTSSTKNTDNSDFYQKLLGLQNEIGTCTTNVMRGSISPYSISILKEIRNVMELIKQMPASLISIVMVCAGIQQNTGKDNNNTDLLAFNLKSQELVVKLSNCMNDMMQITSLLNMIKPIKLFDKDFDTVSPTTTTSTADSSISRSSNPDHSVMRKLYYSRNNLNVKKNQREQVSSSSSSSPPLQQLQEIEKTLELFVFIGWKLLDDLELGWF